MNISQSQSEALLRSLERLLLEFDLLIEGGHIPEVRDDFIFDDARKAVARAKGPSAGAPPHELASFEQGLVPGLYVIDWKSGGSSAAAIGMKEDGSRWIAPVNWVAPSVDSSADLWGEIERTYPVIAYR
jgi:hypothetical protein